MRNCSKLTICLAGVALFSVAQAFGEEVNSGVEVGGSITTYSTTKCGGIDDGVKTGQSLCYTWRLGGRPVIFVFAKTPDESLASLVKKLDEVVAKHQEEKLAAVINFSGERTDEYSEQIAEFGKKHGVENVALTVTADAERFKVNDDAEVTVMHYRNKKVAFNHAVGKNGLDAKTITKIVDGVKTILE